MKQKLLRQCLVILSTISMAIFGISLRGSVSSFWMTPTMKLSSCLSTDSEYAYLRCLETISRHRPPLMRPMLSNTIVLYHHLTMDRPFMSSDRADGSSRGDIDDRRWYGRSSPAQIFVHFYTAHDDRMSSWTSTSIHHPSSPSLISMKFRFLRMYTSRAIFIVFSLHNRENTVSYRRTR